jgi:hypothetical protein
VETRHFFWEPAPGSAIYASLDENGIVSFAIEAVPGSPVRGTEMFNRMMTEFGSEVRGIVGSWRIGFQGRPSTNIDKVNELTGSGVSLDEAIKHAWTVTRAAKWGFTKLYVVGLPEGGPGHYVRLEVLVEKP